MEVNLLGLHPNLESAIEGDIFLLEVEEGKDCYTTSELLDPKRKIESTATFPAIFGHKWRVSSGLRRYSFNYGPENNRLDYFESQIVSAKKLR
jgi:hypothetical protein